MNVRNSKLLLLVYLLLSVPLYLLAVSVVPISASDPMPNRSVAFSPQRPTLLSDWLQFGFDPQHSANNPIEATVASFNVSQLQQIFQISLPAVADGAPVYLHAVNTPNGIKNLVFVTTKDGRITAIAADTGAPAWSKQHGPGSCKINNGSSTCYTTSSPVIDPNGQYIYSYGLDGKVHKHQVGDGTEITTGGWPETTSLKDFDEKGSSALSFATDNTGTTYLYVTNGGYPGDNGDYQGHVTAINLATGSQNVFNTMCSDQAVHFVEQPGTPDCAGVQSAIWARPGVVYDTATNEIYMATGNGDYTPASHYWGDTILALNPNGTGAGGNPLQTYTPTNFQQLQNGDIDLGSTAPAILPVPITSTVQNLAVQGGKDAKLRLLNLANLSGQGGTGKTGGEIELINVPQGGEVLTQPAVWVNPSDHSTWVFVANDNGIAGLKVTLNGSHVPHLTPMWHHGNGGTSPIIANNILYYAGDNNIWGLDPATGTTLWHDTGIGGIHWESPIVVNGVLYITDESSHLTAYALNGTLTRYNVFLPSIQK